MVVNLANFIEYFATPISGQVTFQRQGYESDLAFAMDAKCGMYRNRQTTLRMDRHETIVAERCETFRYYCIVGVLG